MQPALIARDGGLRGGRFSFLGLSHQSVTANNWSAGVLGLTEPNTPQLQHSIYPVFAPAIRASASNKMAKSFSASPIPRAVVSISFVIAVVGSGTSSWR